MVKEANRWFGGLERRLERRDWIACADFTMADILLATVLRDIQDRPPCAISESDRLLCACAGTTGLAAHAQPVRQASRVEIADIQWGRALLRMSAVGRKHERARADSLHSGSYPAAVK